MSIYTINRYTANQAGGGLPFYTQRQHQHRFLERPQQNMMGYMETPNNRFPTFQFLFNSSLAAFATVEVIQVLGQKDGTIYNVPATTGSFFEICLDGRPERFFYTIDFPLGFALPSGLYYFHFVDGGNNLYSEVFHLGGNIACVNPTVGGTVVVDGPAGTVDIDVAVLTTSGLTVSGTPQIFSPSNPAGIDYTLTVTEDIPSGGSIEVRVETNTVEYGLFKSYFDVGYTNPQQVTITAKAV